MVAINKYLDAVSLWLVILPTSPAVSSTKCYFSKWLPQFQNFFLEQFDITIVDRKIVGRYFFYSC